MSVSSFSAQEDAAKRERDMMTSKDGLIRSVARTLQRIADSFADIEGDAPHQCESCGGRARAGRRFCSEHEGELVTRH
jgi:hypothetical protein